MRRVKLMLDPNGSAKGQDIPLEDIQNMTEEERARWEGDQMMRSMGNKCLRKLIETAIMAALLTFAMFQFGFMDIVIKKLNPQLYERPIVNGPSADTLNEL